MNKFYEVTTADGMGGSKFLGYASGTKEDILKYYQHKKVCPVYDIYFRELSLVDVSSEMAEENEKIFLQKMELQKQLNDLNQKLI
ncbi:hypothetical protein [Chryseobacterium bernardetii]|uniref:hypothetical protein n=1 Tax=Chryseobacterium bernardetii TaxID=1241978 RepID=UPI0016252006|nr:hypothetical protein [Chryseobacterium bernardetii]